MAAKSHNLAYLLSAIFCLLLSCPRGFSQSGDSQARKFDEFNDIMASDLIARLDNLAIQLQNEPNTKTFLVVYRTRRDLPGLSNRYTHRMKNYLADSRGISPERIVTVDGGMASCLIQELWIVPSGTAPQPRADAYLSSNQPSVYKFDEHHYSSPKEDPDGLIYWPEAPGDLFGYLEAFAEELQKHPQSIGFLVAYRSENRDRPRVAQTMLRTERNFLIREFRLKPGRIKTIDGGYRQWRTMELWIAQEPGEVPVITTYRSAPKRQRR